MRDKNQPSVGEKPVGQSSVTRVLVVAKRDPQEPIAASLKRAGYAVLRANSSLAATRSLEHARPDVMVIHEHALGRREAESLSNVAAQHHIPVLLVSHPTAGASGVSADSVARRVETLLAESRSSRAGASAGSGPAYASAGDTSGNGLSSGSRSETERLAVGALVVDLDQHTVKVDGVPLDLTAKEFELLCQFARRPGRVWSRQQLIDLIWGYDYVDPRVVTVHIGNLRRKLEKGATGPAAGAGPASAAGAVHIEAVRGVGYRLTSPADRPVDRPPAVDRRYESGRLPFVGRERELEVLRRAVDAATNGEVRGAAIVGDPGIGKTRLAEEAASCARHGGAHVYWGKCREALAKPVYEPWVEILEQWKRESPAGEFDQVFAEEPLSSVWSPVDGESARLCLFDRLASAVRRKAAAGALCLVIDDLHWADPSTLLALQYVLDHLREAPVMLLLTYRPCDAAQAPLLTEVMTDLVRGDLGVILPLRPLSQSEVGLFVKLSGLGRKSSEPTASLEPEVSDELAGSAKLVAEVYRETEGDPFFLTQLVRLRLLQGESSESPLAGRSLSREEGVRRVVLSRLSRLSAPCREALDVAGVIGREFTQPLLAGTMGLAPEPLLERLAEAIDMHILLIREDAPEGYRFVHSIFQDVLRDQLSPQRRASLHAKVGTVLEHLHGDELDAYSADLAHHFSEAVPAGFAAQAVDHCLRAGRVAFSQCAWDEACSQLHRAVDLIDLLPAETPQRSPIFAGKVWEELGDVYHVMADHDRAVEAYHQAARRVPPEERLWQARLRDILAWQHNLLHHDDQALACLAEADALLGPPTKGAEASWWDTWIDVQTDRGWLHFYNERLEELYRLLDQVEKTAGTHGGSRNRAWFEQLQLVAGWTRRRFVSTSETLKLAQRCAESFREAGAPRDLMNAESVLAEAQLWLPERRGDIHDQLVRFRDLAERNHTVCHQVAALWFLEIWDRWRGEVDTVHNLALETLPLVMDAPGLMRPSYGAAAKGHLSWVAWRTGDLDKARTLAAEALREIGEAGYSPFEWQARWTLLGLGLLDENWYEASRQAEAMLDQSQQKMPDDLEELLRRLVEEHTQARPPGSETIEALTMTARACGYL